MARVDSGKWGVADNIAALNSLSAGYDARYWVPIRTTIVGAPAPHSYPSFVAFQSIGLLAKRSSRAVTWPVRPLRPTRDSVTSWLFSDLDLCRVTAGHRIPAPGGSRRTREDTDGAAPEYWRAREELRGHSRTRHSTAVSSGWDRWRWRSGAGSARPRKNTSL